MKKLFFFAALGAAALTGCSEGQVYNNDAAASGKEITMRAVMEKTTDGRASAMTKERFGSFHVTAFRDDVTYESTDRPHINTVAYRLEPTADISDNWTYSPKAYYPTDADGNAVTLSFYAHAPVSDMNMDRTSFGFNNYVFTYTVPHKQNAEYGTSGSNEGVGVAEDLLVAYASRSTGTVPFEFEHALSAATFRAANNNPGESELVYVITEISITNLNNIGDFTYGGGSSPAGTWSAFSGPVNYIAPLPQSGVALEPKGPVAEFVSLLSANDFLIILPQAPGDFAWGSHPGSDNGDTYVKVVYNLRDGNGNMIENGTARYLTVSSGELSTLGFEMGKRYDFTFTFGPSNAIEMEATVKDWNASTPTPPLN